MTNTDDFNARAAEKRLAVLQAARARAVADLAEYQTVDDDDNAAETVQMIATLDDQAQSIVRLAQREHARMNPAREERESVITSRRLPKDGDDALDIINYGKMANDPTRLTPDEYNRQQAELYRLKSKGMYQS